MYSYLLLYICSRLQLPDADSPYYFSLPDNIERSLQRTTSAALIKQLRVLSSSDLEASKYDREKWRAQVSERFIVTTLLPGNSPRSARLTCVLTAAGTHPGAVERAHVIHAGPNQPPRRGGCGCGQQEGPGSCRRLRADGERPGRGYLRGRRCRPGVSEEGMSS
jgi:hypothetical protein